MTVTITTPPPGNTIGLGATISVVTDFSPLPAAWEWVINFYQDAAHLNQAFQQIINPPSASITFQIGLNTTGFNFNIGSGGVLLEDSTAYVRAVVLDTSDATVKDSVNTSFSWANVPFLAQWLTMNPMSGGGLTEAQAIQLDDIQSKSTDTLDALTIPVGSPVVQTPLSALLTPTITSDLLLQEITSGPTGSFVGATLGAFVNAIIIRITAIPLDQFPQTPDDDYYLRTLATVRIYHSDDLYLRVPIHTTSKIIELSPSFWGTAIAAVETAIWPASVTLQVEWFPGVEGQVFKSVAP